MRNLKNKTKELNKTEIDFLNRPINYEEIESVINNLPKNKTPGPGGLGNSGEFWGILPNMQRRNNTYSPKAITKSRNRRKATKLTL